LIGWSPNGWRLLVDVFSVAEFREPLIYDARSGKVTEFSVSNLFRARFDRLFDDDCQFNTRVVRWLSNNEVLLRVTPPLGDDPEQHSCVKRPLLYGFSVQRNRVRRVPS